MAIPTVAICFGGVSAEHEISCLTAGGVSKAIDPDRFQVVGIGITKAGKLVRVSLEQLRAFAVPSSQLPSLSGDYPAACLLQLEEGGVAVATHSPDGLTDVVPIDVAFPLLHGPFGEDGTIQGWFEMLSLPYVGAGVAASAMSMDKDLTKRMLSFASLPVVPWVLVTDGEWKADRVRLTGLVAELGYPVFVKPARSGSSVGMSRVVHERDLDDAIETALRHDPRVIVEAGLVGARELEVAVLQGHFGDPPRVSRPGEIIVSGNDGFYDYQSKYLDVDYVSLQVPADLTEPTEERLRLLAARVFVVMGVEGLARVDFFLPEGGEPVVNELNTMPGFTTGSLFPRMWEASGVSYPELVADLIDLALERPIGLR
ncbi:MAG: D-alanine--D-alanine ligase [Propionibacteriaceae bacterium]|jgi:D-alanine-D-alanine ligase|nr:D-alanine--D-alanine ligase [Propionibacteriaceae bacterium]